MINNKLSELDLTIPVLFILDRYGPMDTAILKQHLFRMLDPSGSNLTPLLNRNDNAIDQIVRNVVSHRMEYTTNIIYRGLVNYKDGNLEITDLGIEELENNIVSHIINSIS